MVMARQLGGTDTVYHQRVYRIPYEDQLTSAASAVLSMTRPLMVIVPTTPIKTVGFWTKSMVCLNNCLSNQRCLNAMVVLTPKQSFQTLRTI